MIREAKEYELIESTEYFGRRDLDFGGNTYDNKMTGQTKCGRTIISG